MRTTTTILVAALATLPGCACDTAPAGAVVDCQAGAVVPEAVQTDILFVIDDSGSMSQEQANLRDNLAAFIDALVASPVQNDFRIGVTSTSVDEYGTTGGAVRVAYDAGPAIGVPYPAGALVAIDQSGGAPVAGDLVFDLAAYPATGGWGGARVLDKGDGSPAALAALARDFKANVLLGTSGSGKEQPLRAARLALSARLADANAGFLRPGARLAVIIVTDEDDCSDSASPPRSTSGQCNDQDRKTATPPLMDPVEDFAAFLFDPIDGERRDVVVGVIAGFGPSPGDPSTLVPAMCSTAGAGQAFDAADRLAALLDGVGAARMRVASICDASFADTLEGFAEVLMPSSMPLSGAPADWRMLVVTLQRAGGAAPQTCQVAAEGDAGAAAADAVYAPPRFGRPAQLTFQNGCRLGLGDRVDVRLVCAN